MRIAPGPSVQSQEDVLACHGLSFSSKGFRGVAGIKRLPGALCGLLMTMVICADFSDASTVVAQHPDPVFAGVWCGSVCNNGPGPVGSAESQNRHKDSLPEGLPEGGFIVKVQVCIVSTEKAQTALSTAQVYIGSCIASYEWNPIGHETRGPIGNSTASHCDIDGGSAGAHG